MPVPRTARTDSRSEQMQTIGQLAAGIAHEINTPTQYVGDNLRFLEEGLGDLLRLLRKLEDLREAARGGSVPADLLRESLELATEIEVEDLGAEMPRAVRESLEGVDAIARIVQAMKAFSHADGEDKVSVDLHRVIEGAITLTCNQWKMVARVETDLDPEPRPLLGHPGQLTQVVINLLINAAHAVADARAADGTRRKGEIHVCTRFSDGCAKLSIRDNGTGIPEGIRGRVFEPFFTTKELGKGTGQGLSIASEVVAVRHGGTIDFQSETGLGTTFTVRLPLRQEGA